MNKNIFRVLSLFIISLLAVACQKNANWVIVEDVQPGVYITGEATAFQGEAPASQLSQFSDSELDPKPEEVPAHLLYIDTWLKASSNFSISIANGNDDIKQYGKGALLSKTDASEIYELSAGTAITVPEDGLYRILVNTELMQIHIIPIRWGIIGSATPKGWDGESPLDKPTYDDASYTATYTGKYVITANEYKFRYSGNWGYEFDSQVGQKTKFHTNMGLAAKGPLNHMGGTQVGAPGGENITAPFAGEYEFKVTYSLRTRKYEVEAKLIGEPTPPPAAKLPETMFMIGLTSWDWSQAIELTPVNGMVGPNGDKGVSKFWTIKYFPAGAEFKLNYLKAWDGKEFGFSAVTDAAKTFAGITDGGGNIKVGTAGWYLVVVTNTITNNGSEVTNQVDFFAPNVYLVGGTANDQWSTPNTALFTIPSDGTGSFVSPAFAKDGELRIAIALEGIDWWKTEFIVLNDKIEYRGNGGDQTRVNVTAGQKVSLNFGDNTGSIN